jgi:hypothetical protein
MSVLCSSPNATDQELTTSGEGCGVGNRRTSICFICWSVNEEPARVDSRGELGDVTDEKAAGASNSLLAVSSST